VALEGRGRGKHIVQLSTSCNDGDKAEVLTMWSNEVKGIVLLDGLESSGVTCFIYCSGNSSLGDGVMSGHAHQLT
jgi:hypothetical protein